MKKKSSKNNVITISSFYHYMNVLNGIQIKDTTITEIPTTNACINNRIFTKIKL